MARLALFQQRAQLLFVNLETMGKQTKPRKDPLNIRAYTIFGVTVWTLFLGILLNWSINLIENMALERAYVYTKVGFDKDVVYRRWASEHGGVYVRVDSTTPPNPYLSHISERDLVIDSSLKLTLMNPAYMNRQVYELEEEISEIRGHITSLNPIRQENEADEWETKALQEFENGVTEFSEVSSINGEDYFRYMKPLVTEKSCLKCHAQQGYKVNDIRGGVSVSYPMNQVYILIASDIKHQYYSYGLIWVLGLSIFVIAYFFLKKSDNKRLAAENDLLILNSQLEDRVQSRTKNLHQEIAERQIVEAKIEESQQRFQTIFNSVNDGIFLHNAKTGEILDVNNRMLEMFGFSYKEILKLSVGDISSNVPPYTQNEAAEWISKALLGQPQIFEWQSKRKDGTVFWSEVNMRFIIIDGNDCILVSVRDISDRKQVEKDLSVEKEFSEKIINTSNAIIIGLDKNHLIQIFNKGAEKVTGYSEEDMLGKDWFKIFFPKELLEEMNKAWKESWGISSQSYINQILIKTGEERIISWQTTGFYEGEDEAKHLLISIGEDITERKQTEEELEKYREHLEELVKERTKEIEDKNKILERTNKAFVGRELRMKELKKEIKKLKGH